jgi:hypothetical protein
MEKIGSIRKERNMKKREGMEYEETGRKGLRRNRKERNTKKQDENEQYSKRRKGKEVEGKYKEKESVA